MGRGVKREAGGRRGSEPQRQEEHRVKWRPAIRILCIKRINDEKRNEMVGKFVLGGPDCEGTRDGREGHLRGRHPFGMQGGCGVGVCVRFSLCEKKKKYFGIREGDGDEVK